jgi:hypothetical protein
VKLEDMAGVVAAGDTSPAAAVSAAPRGEEASGVICDALLEGEQCGPVSGETGAILVVVGMLI